MAIVTKAGYYFKWLQYNSICYTIGNKSCKRHTYSKALAWKYSAWHMVQTAGLMCNAISSWTLQWMRLPQQALHYIFSQAEFDAYNNNQSCKRHLSQTSFRPKMMQSNIKNIKISRGKDYHQMVRGWEKVIMAKQIYLVQSNMEQQQFMVEKYSLSKWLCGLFLHTGTTPLTLQAINLTAGLSADNKARLHGI